MIEQPVVVMGVAGCGKSSLGAAIAHTEGAQLIEGDEHHSTASRAKMRLGVPLTDADREAWLDALAAELRARPANTVLTCSALKRVYRDRLRAAAPGLRFVFMDIDLESARRRVQTRAQHFFSPALVESQFAALESPVGESGVLRVDALEPLAHLLPQVSRWLHGAGRT
jgi:gluconokinase